MSLLGASRHVILSDALQLEGVPKAIRVHSRTVDGRKHHSRDATKLGPLQSRIKELLGSKVSKLPMDAINKDSKEIEPATNTDKLCSPSVLQPCHGRDEPRARGALPARRPAHAALRNRRDGCSPSSRFHDSAAKARHQRREGQDGVSKDHGSRPVASHRTAPPK